ncbi:MAG: IgA Peptidase M64 [Bacteroidales bacterium]|nr:IgA Peptidase M64 [Bacteroidales bacterium]
MKKHLIITALMMLFCSVLMAQKQTLRVDYLFTGDSQNSSVSLAHMAKWDGWAGRKGHLKEVPLKGNGQACMCDAASGDTLYRISFSTLFQEWQATPKAKNVTKSFENTFLFPMPASSAKITVELYDLRGETTATFSHVVDPKDILIRDVNEFKDVEKRYVWRGSESDRAIDVAIVAEGYAADEIGTFYRDASIAVEAIFAHEPFASLKEFFNFLAVAPVSKDSGVSVPREKQWKQTPVGSHFDTFYSDRYLTTTNIFKLHDILEGLPYEHIIILANTDTYGGGGIYNSYTLTTAHHPQFRPVVVHEFGHSFAGLADEYAYAGEEDPYYFSDIEPWEQNITTQKDFASKWKNMLDIGFEGVGLFEGAGYQPKGVWRPAEDCRMRTNGADAFCPVCQRAIARMINFYIFD